MRNDDFSVRLYEMSRNGTHERPVYWLMPVTPAVRRLQLMAPGDTRRPLLAALDDPARFAAAHVLLTRAEAPQPWAAGDWFPHDEWPDPLWATFNGHRFRLEIEDRLPTGRGMFDPAQHRAIRRYWHERTAVPGASVPHWAVAVASLVLPAAYIVRLARRYWQVKPGVCRRCGYDLRASPQRCPECGTVPPPDPGAHSLPPAPP